VVEMVKIGGRLSLDHRERSKACYMFVAWSRFHLSSFLRRQKICAGSQWRCGGSRLVGRRERRGY
jgi:hypothetical protein